MEGHKTEVDMVMVVEPTMAELVDMMEQPVLVGVDTWVESQVAEFDRVKCVVEGLGIVVVLTGR